MTQKQELKNEYGSMKSTIWMCDDIKIGHAVSSFNRLTSFSSHSDTEVVRLHFGLKGDYAFNYKQLHKSYDLIGGHHNIMYSKNFDMEVHNKTLQIETFGIQFPKNLFIQYTQHSNDLLKCFAESVLEGRSAILSDNWGAIDPTIQYAIQQVVHCKYNGEHQKLFLLSKSIDLLVLCAESCCSRLQKTEPFIKSKADKEKIIAARDLVNERAHCPPNLSEIAKYVGLNEYKLKRGFKETFNTTVFGYLTEQRLHLAQRYLLDTPKTAAEIAYELGYATPQHFNNAFRKKFGTTPFGLRNNP
jgi:AraC family transcriptional regulator, transcriptional activator of the genes for pyochelin and ferripyochelin receptors